MKLGCSHFRYEALARISRWDVAQHLQGLRKRHGRTTEHRYFQKREPREPSLLVSWAPGRLLGGPQFFLLRVLTQGAAWGEPADSSGTGQTSQDPLESQGKVHVPIPGDAPPETRLSRSRPCCPPGAQMRERK